MTFDEWMRSETGGKHCDTDDGMKTRLLRKCWDAAARLAAVPADAVREMIDEIERLRSDRDCEKRLRKDADDLATDLKLALEAVIASPADTGLAHAVLQRIHDA